MKLFLTAAILSVATLASCGETVTAGMTKTTKCYCVTTRTYSQPCKTRKAVKPRKATVKPLSTLPVTSPVRVLPTRIETNVILVNKQQTAVDNKITNNTVVNPTRVDSPTRQPGRTSSSTSVTLNGSFNTTTNNVTPELMISQQLGSDVRVNAYAGFGNTGYSVIAGRPGIDPVYENRVSSFTPGTQYVAAVHYDRSVFFWKNSNGIFQQSVKDCVYTDAQTAEKRQWIINSGGEYYGTKVLASGVTLYATESKTEYTRVLVSPGQTAIADRKQALTGITGGLELGVNVLSPNLSATIGGKIIGYEIAPTVGLNLQSSTEGGYVNIGVRKTLMEGAGTDVRAGGGINF